VGFRENLFQKIKINKLVRNVARSLQTGDAARFDKTAMRELLAFGDYPEIHERDLSLFILEKGADTDRMIVLDNGLGIYQTTLDDVLMRKSPTVKEMISIRNAIKILNDKDVLTSKKSDSLETIRADVVGMLDLSFTPEDIDDLAKDGKASLESNYSDGVLEILSLFAELLHYEKPPKAFDVRHFFIRGKKSAEMSFGPAVGYDPINANLILLQETFDAAKNSDPDHFTSVIIGDTIPSAQGADVFDHLKAAVLDG